MVRADPATRKYLNATPGGGNEAVNHMAAFKRRGLLAACEDAGELKFNELLQSAKRVRYHIEGAMKDGLLSGSEPQDFAATGGVDGFVGMKDAEDDAVGAVLQQESGVATQRGEIFRGIAEISGSRADHGHDGKGGARFGLGERAQ